MIRIDHKNTLLHNLTFNIEENLSDSLLVRVNIYDYHRGFPGENLLRDNIYHTVSKKKGEETIDLKGYNITVDSNIIVSLELIEVYGDAIYFAISASPYKGDSYTKKISQDRWRHYPGFRLGFNLISSYTNEKKQNESIARSVPNDVHIYWDTSFSMKDRDIDEETKLLRKYLRKCNNLTIKVSKFNTDIYETKVFNIENGNSNDLVDYLEESYYHGIASFEEILQKNEFRADAVLLFSNGISQTSTLSPNVESQIFTINSKELANHEKLNNIARYNDGAYLDLTSLKAKEAINYLISDVENRKEYSSSTEDTKENVYGIIYNDEGPVQGAYVILNDSFYIVETDEKGAYSIKANPGDKLTVDAIGMKQKDTIVSSFKKLHIPLKLNAEKLTEVELKTKTNTKDRAEELVDTPYGKSMRGSVGYSLANKITSEDIKPTDIDLMQILMKMPRVFIVNIGYVPPQEPVYGLKRTMFAGINGGLPVVIIDGLIYDQQRGQIVPRISADRIESVTIISSTFGLNRYGSIAAFGAIDVKLKGSYDITNTTNQKKKKEVFDATVKGNDYEEEIITLEDVSQSATPLSYIARLEKASSFSEAKKEYVSLLKIQDSRTVSFYVNVGDYFKKWDKDFAATIYSTVIELAPNNLKVLKTAGYKLEEIGNKEKALALYEYIVNTFPSKTQSYLDVARAYINVKDYKTAGSLYTQMYFNTIPNVDFTDASATIINNLRYLVANHKSQIDFKDLPPEILALNFKKDYRLVFEWNDPLAEFKIQFVNPDKKYFTFSHTEFEDTKLFTSEIERGLHSTEFDIDDDKPGNWLVNIESFEIKDEKNPVYLKYTLYKDFGLSSQTETTRVVNMSALNKKVTLDRIMNNFQN